MFRNQIFKNIISNNPDRPAIWDKRSKSGRSFSYGQLAKIIASLGHSDFARVSVIGILSSRSCEAYISVLSSLYYGIKFIPLNPKFPIQKLSRIKELSNIELVVTDQANKGIAKAFGLPVFDLTDFLINVNCAENCDPAERFLENLSEISAEQIVYQMFTSGSTGEPKGVPISLGSLNSYVTGIYELIKYEQHARFSQMFDLSFDLSMHDIFLCFYASGTLVAATDFDLMMPTHYIESNKIKYWFSVPVLGELVVRSYNKKPIKHRLSIALFCGEALPTGLALNFDSKLVESKGHTWNLYGPTEATIAFTARRIKPSDQPGGVMPLGKPFGDNHIAILTQSGKIETHIKNGLVGELLLGGTQLFSNYSPPVKNDAFVSDGKHRFYKSGDWVQIQNNELGFIGRNDSQVKVHGHRIDLGEIESAFRTITNIDLVAAFTVTENGQNSIILAYQFDADIDARADLKQLIPSYMMPSQFLRFDKIPINSNGKIDRTRLRNNLE